MSVGAAPAVGLQPSGTFVEDPALLDRATPEQKRRAREMFGEYSGLDVVYVGGFRFEKDRFGLVVLKGEEPGTPDTMVSECKGACQRSETEVRRPPESIDFNAPWSEVAAKIVIWLWSVAGSFISSGWECCFPKRER